MADMKSQIESVELASQVAQTLSGVQVRAEAGKAIAVVNGMQEVLQIYGTEMDYESNKKLFDAMVQSANVAVRTSQGAVLKQTLTRSEEDLKSLKDDAEAKVFGAKTGDVIVSINGKQDFLEIEVEGDDSMKEFLVDVVKALNGAYKKSILVAADKLDELAK
jgi:DNA-binding protein YbaB